MVAHLNYTDTQDVASPRS